MDIITLANNHEFTAESIASDQTYADALLSILSDR